MIFDSLSLCCAPLRRDKKWWYWSMWLERFGYLLHQKGSSSQANCTRDKAARPRPKVSNNMHLIYRKFRPLVHSFSWDLRHWQGHSGFLSAGRKKIPWRTDRNAPIASDLQFLICHFNQNWTFELGFKWCAYGFSRILRHTYRHLIFRQILVREGFRGSWNGDLILWRWLKPGHVMKR